MSGHSKWSTIKHKKAAKDAKRGKVFTKIIREIMVAAREGGSDPDHNAKLRNVVSKAKKEGLSMENITRACKKGAGELDGESYEAIIYEGFGPSGVAILIESLTDNRQRTVAEVRHILSKHNGSLGTPGSVSRMFNSKGLLIFSCEATTEDQLMETLLDAGVEDISKNEEDQFEVTCAPESLDDVINAADATKIEYVSAELTKIPTVTVKIEGDDISRMFKIMDLLDDNDDVQNIYANFDVSSEDLAALGLG